MIDHQIKTFMANDQFGRRAAQLEPVIRADIALGKPVNLAAVPDELPLGGVERWLADLSYAIMRSGETLVTLKKGRHNEPRTQLRQCKRALSRIRSRGHKWPLASTRNDGRRQRQAASAVGLRPIGTPMKAAGTSDATVQVQLDGVAVVAVGA